MTSKILALAFNSARRLGNVLVGMAVNADAVTISDDVDGWLRLASYADTPYHHKETDGSWKLYTQRFMKPQGEAMEAAFNALATKRGAKFKGLPIYSGHPDANPERWPDERRLGGVMGVQAREDGLYVLPAWNSLGDENRKEAFLVYPSPSWLYDTDTAKRTGIILPDELRSVGLTNTPRIQDSIPWVNTDAPGAPDHDTAANSSMIPTWLVSLLFGLQPDATQEQIRDAAASAKIAFNADAAPAEGDAKPSILDWLKEVMAKPFAEIPDDVKMALRWLLEAKEQQADIDRLKGELSAAAGTAANSQARISALESSEGMFRQAAINAHLDGAITAGRITAAERPDFERAFATNFDEATVKLGERKPALNTKPLGLAVNRDDLSTPALRTYAYNSRADELKRENSLRTEDEVTAAMRADDKGKVIIAAMEAAK